MSYCKIDAFVVLKACNGWLDHRRKYIQAYKDEKIEKKMAARWWRKAISREKAIECLENGDSFSGYHLINLNGSHWKTKVKELKVLAEAANANDTQVYLSAEMADTLEHFLELNREGS